MNFAADRKNDFQIREAACFIAAHLAATLYFAFSLNVWADEASTLYSTSGGILQTFYTGIGNEKQAPLYFLALSLWRSFDDSIFFARLFSIICSAAAIWQFHRLSRDLFDPKAALFISAVFSLHPYLFWASLEIRVYSLIILISVILIRYFREAFIKNDGKAGNPGYIFLAAAVGAVYTNYYLGFLLVGFFVYLLAMQKWREAGRYLLYMLAAGIAIFPLLILIKGQIATNTSGFQSGNPAMEGIRLLWNNILTFLLPAEIYAPPDPSLAAKVRIWAVRAGIAIALYFAFRRRASLPKENLLLFGILCAAALAFMLLAYKILGMRYVEIRHAAIFFAPLILFAGIFFAEIFPRKLWIAIGLIMAIFYGHAYITLYPDLVKRGDWARVSAYIESEEKPGQPIIVYLAYDALAMKAHYRGLNAVFPDEKYFSFEFESAYGSEGQYKEQTAFILSEIPPEAEEIWLIAEEPCIDSSKNKSCAPLEKYIEAHYTIEKTKDFYLSRVRLLKKKKNGN